MRTANWVRGTAFFITAALWTAPLHAQVLDPDEVNPPAGQPGNPAAGQPGDQPATPPPAEPPADVASDPAWQLYDLAFERLALEDVDNARVLLRRLRDQFPGHPAAAQAMFRLTDLGDTPMPGHGGAADDRGAVRMPGARSSSDFARAELTLTMTIGGVFMGYQACRMFGCVDGGEDNSRAIATAVMLGGGGGLGLTLYLTRNGITQGQAQLFSSSTTWGTWNALLLNDDEYDPQSEAAVSLAFQAGGLGAGFLLDRVWSPTSGEVAVANTVGVWTTVLTALAHGMAEEEPELTTLVIAGDLGLVLGGALGSYLPGISRGRTLLIDTGGILGLLGGGLVAALGDANDESTVFTSLFVGTGLGLGIATLATRHWDTPSVGTMRMNVVPMGTRGWGAAVSLNLD